MISYRIDVLGSIYTTILMTHSDFVTISNFLYDVLTFLLKVTHIRCVHFTLHLVKQAKNSIYDITNPFE